MAHGANEHSEDLREAWELYGVVMDASPDCVFVSDAETHHFLYVNEAACRMTGFSREELMKIPGYRITGRSPEEAARSFAETIRAGADGITDDIYLLTSRDGKRKGWWETHRRAVRVGERWMMITVAREVTARVLAEQALERSRRMYAALSATNEVVMRGRTPDELYQGVCDALVEAGGVPFASLLLAETGEGDLRPAAIAGADGKAMRQAAWPALEEDLNGLAFRHREPCLSDDFGNDPRTRAWHEMARGKGLKTAAAVPVLRDGKAIGVLFLCSEQRRTFDDEAVRLLQSIAENLVFGLLKLEQEMDRELAEERVRFLATHDSLTGLPNRSLFGELADQAIARARRNGSQLAILFIDLDRFKLINDTLGHAAGDILLKEMSGRLAAALRDSDVLARLGGDEFVVLLGDPACAEDAAVVARKLLGAALSPVEIMGQECRVTASIGISLFPEHGLEHSELMKNADTAMYVAKEKGKNACEFYEADMRSTWNERLALETALRSALANNEFSLHYQAKLDLATNAVNGVEALLRWNSATLGDVPPQQFIPLCEESGSIVPIGRWVLREACAQNVAWQRQGVPPVTMAVNLSARQFLAPELLDDIRDALADSGMDANLLELELTESMVMLDPAHTIRVLTELRSLGVRVALDDFGVGYSSLAQIKGFPIDTVKVDRSFIRNLPHSEEDRAITEAIVSMARTLSLRVIAEGVETEAQETYLRGLNCDESQGFYFSEPVPASELSALLTSHGRS